MDVAILNDALRRYIKDKDKNINLLLKYSKEFRIYNITRKYMEMLQ